MDGMTEIDIARRKFLVHLLGAGAFATLPGCAGSGGGGMPREMPDNRSIYRLEGNVSVNGRDAGIETLIRPGDTVVTKGRSSVIFVVEKDAFILHADSSMEITPASAGSAFKLARGKLLSVLATRRTTITTPTAVIGIHGTGIYLESEPEGSYVCLCYGAADLAPADDPAAGQSLVSRHHDAPRYILADSSVPQRVQPAPFKNHDDQELLLIETLVGRTTPFVVPGGVTRFRSTWF